ncbi:AAA family ATPase [Sphingomonas sp. 28-62-11]|uniref:AAA family ATPase n=1 Tax=Sphingomonas sp. 28-62-11 TaxID=1970432 RepID=UPI0035A960EE
MQFTIIDRGKNFPSSGRNQAFLRVDFWNDFSFVTMFEVLLYDEHGTPFEMGSVKIGFYGQTTATSTYKTFDSSFTGLSEQYFSVGQDVKYYDILGNRVSETTRILFLRGLRDIVFDERLIETVKSEDVFSISLLRYVSLTSIDGQFRRVLNGGVPLTDFDFIFKREPTSKMAGVELSFKVNANSAPSTNIHSIIGRNGVGKTTILNEMISAIMTPDATIAHFLVNSMFSRDPIGTEYFSSLVSVAFSAFDPFMPPVENSDPSRGTRYSYIGLKDIADDDGVLLKSLTTLRAECVASIGECFVDQGRKDRWRVAIETLESDENFAVMELPSLLHLREEALQLEASRIVKLMSSGHAVVLLTISRLVSRVEEKTLVLIDEPESHLHPPLLSAFTRALSELLHNRNGVAIDVLP